MNFKRNVIKYFVFLLSLGACNSITTNEVSIESLLKEMTDLDGIAKLSDLEYKTLQASSYSRKAKEVGKDGWFDNADASQFVRVDTIDGRIEHVLMDVDGPGTIVRFWSTWHAQKFSMGTLRFYFDNSPTPQIEGRIDQVISANQDVGEPLSQTTAPFLENDGWFSGHNLYFPLPYANHCKVTYQKADEKVNDVLYYQINYREYPKGTSVETYEKAGWENAKYLEAISIAKDKIEDPDISQAGLKDKMNNGIIVPGKTLATTLDGTKAIKQLSVKINADNMEQALRSTVLTMEFDGKQTVWVPLGDFFGTGYKISPYQCRYSRVTNEGEMTILFPMPFQESAKIALHNYGSQDVEVEKMELMSSDWNWNERSLYFHANWRLYSDIATNKKQDVNFISISGKGKYVGDVLTLYNNSKWWWGEGDEKIFVDGEEFPSHFGTGTEDYYGYAWCSVVNFSNPFLAQPCGEGNRSPGMTVNSRWRMLDVVPFNTSYHFDMELWHWDTNIKMDYAPTVFWYGTYDSKVEYRNDKKSVQIPVKLSNKFEGENFTVEKINGGEVINQAFLSHDWSAQNQLLWRNIKEGDKLTTSFYSPWKQSGTLNAVFTQSPEYVKVDVFLNGELVFADLDLYSEKLGLRNFTNESGHIEKSINNLTFIVKDANKINPNANKLGFDYLKIE